MQPIRQALPTYGRNLLSALDRELFKDCVAWIAPEPWESLKAEFPEEPKAAIVPASMEQTQIEEQIAAAPKTPVVFGIGGGSACDAAKLCAWKNGAKLVLVPTVLSSFAPFTKFISVRVDHRVRCVGEVYPEHLLIDFGILEKSPAKLNRAGAGDLLPVVTALPDWRLAREEKGETFIPTLAAKSQTILDRLIVGAADISDCSEKGLRLLSELFVGEIALCEKAGNSRPKDGSEHLLAECLESITKKTYTHGELVACCVLLSLLYQNQPAEPIKEFLDRCGIEYKPENIRVTYEELEQALVAMPEYLKADAQLPFGIFHHKGMVAARAKGLLEAFKTLIGGA